MAQRKTTIGDMILVGAVAYQLYSRIYYGQVEYYAEIGRPYTDKATGRTSIIPQMKAVATRDFLAAAEQAATKLEELRAAQFKHGLATNAQTITPIKVASCPPSDSEPDDVQQPLSLKLA
ncbi:hypothetical protein KOR34_21230 [Posidoniimonas corsicana]|uniref:Uncharacterized protein n=1 Tax=Posidoniimonas corsicana TaxID=1938618 RepID=A0A5C5VEV5_9BACT|nr:hypothetical protein [Posidoniimonas corsicana]TWT37176.1 hypothetical protein KOR34_21230 [Posidoniimonas corsicana]